MAKEREKNMRLWHQAIIPYLDRQRLLSQHRECAALRGAGWGKKHATVDYVFTHEPAYLVAYHNLVMDEMARRGYHVSEEWYNADYRGKKLEVWNGWADKSDILALYTKANQNIKHNSIFPEHNLNYLMECLSILKQKHEAGAMFDDDWIILTEYFGDLTK